MCLYTSTFLLIPLLLTIYSYFWLIAASESLSLDALRSLKMRSMIAVILPVCLLIVAVVWIFKSRLSAEQKKNRVGILDRCKKNITVGSQGIVVTTIVGRLYAFCVVDNAFVSFV
ncbi:hypothetical protein CRE_29067 [Caenorhabditis remanei]|uniref:Uncharacterized protein n=1 Tax=Caenorhabditis remanei TaxID=31234 RepID=E3MW87_CAERE|nr:hypothetical protein CRE_29067 [Caenorhabditis remanei]